MVCLVIWPYWPMFGQLSIMTAFGGLVIFSWMRLTDEATSLISLIVNPLLIFWNHSELELPRGNISCTKNSSPRTSLYKTSPGLFPSPGSPDLLGIHGPAIAWCSTENKFQIVHIIFCTILPCLYAGYCLWFQHNFLFFL